MVSNHAARRACGESALPQSLRPLMITHRESRAPNVARTCWRLALVVTIAVPGACTPRFVAERWVLGDRTTRTADIEFGPDERQRLDVYRPIRTAGAPVVVFLYGGRWKYGTKDDYLLIGNSFARRGWITVIPNYRLHPQAYFPAWVRDGAAAVRWTIDNIEQFGGDTSRIVVVGHSAGAHTAALLALDERYLRDAGVEPGAVRGFVSVAGPVDTTWTAPDVQRLMGPPEGWPSSYPSTHIGMGDAPLLLMHGDADDVVTVGNSVRLADRITDHGGCAPLRIYRGVGHVDIAVALGLPALVRHPILEDLARFVRDVEDGGCPPGD